ncbi:MAG: WD40 repeat domain-containing protein, partial [Bdellovibrionales bacterium]|nr:WD40 repeat domain-containing protein [Bdellovibrionales bacterium]
VSSDGGIFLVRVEDQKVVLLGKVSHSIESASFDASRGIIGLSYRGQVFVHDLVSLGVLAKTDKTPGRVLSLAISPTKDEVLIGAADGRVYRWAWRVNVHASERKRGRADFERYMGHSSVVSSVGYHPGGRVFFSGDWNGTVVAWKGYDEDPYQGEFDSSYFDTGFFGEEISSRVFPQAGGGRVEYLFADREGHFVAVGYDSGDFDLWELRGLQRKLRTSLHRGAILQMDVDFSRQEILCIGRDNELKVSRWDEYYDPVLADRKLKHSLVFKKSLPTGTSAVFVGAGRVLIALAEGEFQVLEKTEIEANQ